MRLRQGFRAALAALCVVVGASCKVENIARARAVAIDVGNLIVVKDTVRGTCADTIKVGTGTATSTIISNGGITLQIGEEANVKAGIISSCGNLSQNFHWTSNLTNVATAVDIDSNNGRVKGIGPGTAIVCAEWLENRAFKACFPVRVLGGSGGGAVVSIGPFGQGISSCLESPRTLQMVVNPTGIAGTWTVSGISGATVSSSGLVTVPQGSSGVVVVTFTPTGGAAVNVSVSVSNANCAQPTVITVGPAGQVVSTCPSSSRTLQMTVSPAGTIGTWTVSGISGATITSSGMLTLPQGTSGLVVVTFTPGSGSAASVQVSVSNANCATQVTVGPSGQTISSCTDASRSIQMNVSPAGTAGVWSVSGISGATVNSSGLVTVPQGSAGTVVVTFTPTGGTAASVTVNVTANCGPTPTISVNPTSLTLNMGSFCPAASASFTVTVGGVANPVLVNLASSNTGVATASANGLVVTVTTAGGGSANITGAIQGTNLTFSVPVNVTTNTCGGGLITFNPSAVCLSTTTGGTTAPLIVNASGMPAGTVINVSSGNTGVVTVSPSTITAPSGTVTLTRVSTPAANTNVTITASGNGTQNAMNVAVLTTACSNSSIDYTPAGGSINFTTTTLTATVVIGSDNLIAPKPFWTSNHPELLTVRGNESQPITIGGINYYWGFTATLQKVATIPSGRQIEICVQWYPDFGGFPKGCHIWTAP